MHLPFISNISNINNEQKDVRTMYFDSLADEDVYDELVNKTVNF